MLKAKRINFKGLVFRLNTFEKSPTVFRNTYCGREFALSFCLANKRLHKIIFKQILGSYKTLNL